MYPFPGGYEMLFGNVFRFKLRQVMFQLLPGDKIQVDA